MASLQGWPSGEPGSDASSALLTVLPQVKCMREKSEEVKKVHKYMEQLCRCHFKQVLLESPALS